MTVGILAAGLLIASGAFAMDPGTQVYVRARDTKAYPKPNAKGTPVTLQPTGDAYTWEGHTGLWNRVKTKDDKELWIYGRDLSLHPPVTAVDVNALSSNQVSGMSAADAMRGLGDGAQWYAGKIDPAKSQLAVRKVATAQKISIEVQPKVLEKLKSGGDQ